MRRVAIYWMAFALVVGAAYGAAAMVRHFRGSDAAAIVHVERPVPLPSAGPPLESFELTDTQGKPFSSAELRGKVWLGSFFFTNCPSACRKLNQAISSVQRRFPDLLFVSITCDPQNDTPEVLAKYAELFQADPARWHFLTGKMDYIQRIGTELFKVTVVQGGHSTRAALVGRDGQIVDYFEMLDPGDLNRLDEAIAKALAAETPPLPPGEGPGVRAAGRPAAPESSASAVGTDESAATPAVSEGRRPSPQPSPSRGRGGRTP